VPRGRPLGSKNKPKPPKSPKLDALELPPAEDLKLSYTEASAAANESQDTAPVSKAWLRRMICRARIAVLDGIITDSQALPALADTLLGLRRVRAHYAQRLAELAATAEPGDPDFAEPSRSTAGDTLRERAANR